MSRIKDPRLKSKWDTPLAFLIGGVSGCLSTCVVQPIDMLKVRIQLKSEALGKGAKISPIGVLRDIINSGEGLLYFYKGLDSALMRQITYTMPRLGIYKTLFNNYKEKHGSIPIQVKSCIGVFSGFIGSLCGNPSDLILVRLQSDKTLPKEKRRNYRHFGDAFKRIIKEEGVLTLWRGAGPTIVRAMFLNFGMLAPYDEIKERINSFTGTHDTK